MNRFGIALSSVVFVGLSIVACDGSADTQEPVAETSSKLEGSDGCFAFNPECALNNGGQLSDWTPDAWAGPGPDACMRRAHDWSIWCGNTDGAPSAAHFRVGGNLVAATGFAAPPSRCVISQPVCAKANWAQGTWGDDYAGSNGDPNRCLQRAVEYSQWCGNPSGAPTRAVWDAPGAGVHVETTYVAP